MRDIFTCAILCLSVSSYITRAQEGLMGFPTKVQLIQRKHSQQWYINFPSAVAQAMEFTRGEVVEWIVEDKNRLLLRRRQTPATAQKNQTRQGVMAHWNSLFDPARTAFSQQRTFQRARTLGLSALTCLGRHTLSGLLYATGQQFRDWSAAYRLFERERLDSDALWRVPLG